MRLVGACSEMLASVAEGEATLAGPLAAALLNTALERVQRSSDDTRLQELDYAPLLPRWLPIADQATAERLADALAALVLGQLSASGEGGVVAAGLALTHHLFVRAAPALAEERRAELLSMLLDTLECPDSKDHWFQRLLHLP